MKFWRLASFITNRFYDKKYWMASTADVLQFLLLKWNRRYNFRTIFSIFGHCCRWGEPCSSYTTGTPCKGGGGPKTRSKNVHCVVDCTQSGVLQQKLKQFGLWGFLFDIFEISLKYFTLKTFQLRVSFSLGFCCGSRAIAKAQRKRRSLLKSLYFTHLNNLGRVSK